MNIKNEIVLRKWTADTEIKEKKVTIKIICVQEETNVDKEFFVFNYLHQKHSLETHGFDIFFC